MIPPGPSAYPVFFTLLIPTCARCFKVFKTLRVVTRIRPTGNRNKFGRVTAEEGDNGLRLLSLPPPAPPPSPETTCLFSLCTPLFADLPVLTSADTLFVLFLPTPPATRFFCRLLLLSPVPNLLPASRADLKNLGRRVVDVRPTARAARLRCLRRSSFLASLYNRASCFICCFTCCDTDSNM